MSDFFKTRAGMELIQFTLPRIANALERIAAIMEKQAEQKQEKENQED